jgi:hypothetical protein
VTTSPLLGTDPAKSLTEFSASYSAAAGFVASGVWMLFVINVGFPDVPVPAAAVLIETCKSPQTSPAAVPTAARLVGLLLASFYSAERSFASVGSAAVVSVH